MSVIDASVVMYAELVLCVLIIVRRVIGASVVFVQAEDGIRDLVRSRGLGDVYKRQGLVAANAGVDFIHPPGGYFIHPIGVCQKRACHRHLSLIHI